MAPFGKKNTQLLLQPAVAVAYVSVVQGIIVKSMPSVKHHPVKFAVVAHSCSLLIVSFHSFDGISNS